MKYWAFLSYSHTDKKWGDWLHKALETYRVPRRLIGKESREGGIPERVYPIFRDREELPVSSDLGSNINEALGESRYLIVICSPRSAPIALGRRRDQNVQKTWPEGSHPRANCRRRTKCE